jgi:hypothetical protein
MSYRIDPNGYCATEGCTRPRATGEEVCSQCSRLGRAVGTPSAGVPKSSSAQTLEGEAKPPRCVAYLSMAGDVITLELTGGPRFTEADVEAVAAVLSNFRSAA